MRVLQGLTATKAKVLDHGDISASINRCAKTWRCGKDVWQGFAYPLHHSNKPTDRHSELKRTESQEHCQTRHGATHTLSPVLYSVNLDRVKEINFIPVLCFNFNQPSYRPISCCSRRVLPLVRPPCHPVLLQGVISNVMFVFMSILGERL